MGQETRTHKTWGPGHQQMSFNLSAALSVPKIYKQIFKKIKSKNLSLRLK